MSLIVFLSIHSLLADILQLNDWKDDPRQGILVDLYFYTLQYPFALKMLCTIKVIMILKGW